MSLYHLDGGVQQCGISNALAMEIPESHMLRWYCNDLLKFHDYYFIHIKKFTHTRKTSFLKADGLALQDDISHSNWSVGRLIFNF